MDARSKEEIENYSWNAHMGPILVSRHGQTAGTYQIGHFFRVWIGEDTPHERFFLVHKEELFDHGEGFRNELAMLFFDRPFDEDGTCKDGWCDFGYDHIALKIES
jgi:hypothetical protein